MIIYSATNKTNGKMYIGATKKALSQRKSHHYYDAKHRDTKCRFHRALLEYGKEEFEWIIIGEVDNKVDLDRLEMYYIGYYDTYNNGYNETLGGKGMRGMRGRKRSDITKQRMSEAGKGKNNSRARAVIIGDKHFNTLKEAGEFIGVDFRTVWSRINHSTKWLDYQYAKKQEG